MWWAVASNELYRIWQLKSTLCVIQYHIHITAPIDLFVPVIPVIIFFHCTSLCLSYIVCTETPAMNILTVFLCSLFALVQKITHDAQWLIQNNVYYITELLAPPKRLRIHQCPFVCWLVCGLFVSKLFQHLHQFLREWCMNFDGKYPSQLGGWCLRVQFDADPNENQDLVDLSKFHLILDWALVEVFTLLRSVIVIIDAHHVDVGACTCVTYTAG